MGGLLLSGYAQIELPSLSPEAEFRQTVGYTNFTVKYGRPSVRGRTIMGDLVPFGKLWRTGGGPPTIVSFDRDVVIGDKTVVAGSYILVTIPGEQTWTVMLNANTSRLIVLDEEYDIATETARVVIESKPFPFLETFTIIPEISGNSLYLILSWENTSVRIEIKTLTNEHVEQQIAALTDESNNHESLGATAYYFLRTGQQHERALKMVNQAIKLRKEPWYLETRMKLFAAMGNYPEANKAMENAVKFLQETKPNYWEGYVESLRAEAASWKSSQQ